MDGNITDITQHMMEIFGWNFEIAQTFEAPIAHDGLSGCSYVLEAPRCKYGRVSCEA